MIFDPDNQFADPEESDDFDLQTPPPAIWAIPWDCLEPVIRWVWFDWLWRSSCLLGERYLLPLRSGWWRNESSVEALAALAAWTASYDSGRLDDPAGKLGLLFELGQVGELLREGLEPFSPTRDRPEFERFLAEIGAEPPDPEDELAASELDDWLTSISPAEFDDWPRYTGDASARDLAGLRANGTGAIRSYSYRCCYTGVGW